MNTPPTAYLAEIIRKHEGEILADWLEEQAAGQTRRSQVRDAEARNFISNALKFTLQGSVTVGAHAAEDGEIQVASPQVPMDGPLVLVIEGEASTRMLYEKYLKGTPFRAMTVPTLAAARDMLKARRPSAIVLDILLPGEEGQTWRWLSERLAGHVERPPYPSTAHIPVVVVTSREVDDSMRDRLAPRASAILHKRDLSVETLARTLDAIEARAAH